ncbi:uncharacterized protein LOC142553262 isoform X2 [Primulina tabacum]|uniref:uncharacterized protein LOC142553262 isoform X2 n=1 Tax=Primulina tabacum TaxID=48773 RepID=UPI003F5A70CD
MADQNMVYLPRKLDRDSIFRCKLTLESRYKEIAEKIYHYLNNDERTLFLEQSPFGNLVRYHRDFNISSQIMWYLMSNQIVDTGSDEFWMVVRKRPVRFSLLDYCLITGLDCTTEPVDVPEGGVFGSRHFAGKSEIVLSDLEANMSVKVQNDTSVDVEKLKMASLYFCCFVFGEGTRKKTNKIDPKYLRLRDDLDRFNSYPWGRVAFRDAVRCLKKDLLGRYNYLTDAQGRKDVDGSFLVGGFVLPLQILAYEYYPSVAQKFAKRRDVDGLMLPRMFQWVTNTWPSNRAPSAVDVTAAFGECAIDDCLGFLIPTPEELVSPYYTTGVFVDSAPDAVTTRILELWRQGQTVICSEHHLESPSVQHTPFAHSSPDVSGSRSGDVSRSSSSTSAPMRTGPRVHFGLNPSRNPSPLEHCFERRLTELEDTVTSMRLQMTTGFIETRACIRNINLAIDDLKSSMNLGLDELRSSLTEQIRASFAEMRSHMPVH